MWVLWGSQKKSEDGILEMSTLPKKAIVPYEDFMFHLGASQDPPEIRDQTSDV